MPNGRHGAVLIPRDEVRRLFGSIQGDPVVGKLKGADVVLSDVKRLAESFAERQIFVEGQDVESGTALVVHFGPTRWLWVTEDRPVFEDLKKLWMEWLGRI